MKTWIWTISILSLTQVNAQPGFNNIYQLDSTHAERWVDMVVDQDTLVIFRAGYDMEVENWGINLLKMDTLGNIIHSTFLSDSVFYYIASMGGNELIKTSDGGYALAASSLAENCFSCKFLAKFNHSGDLEFVQHYTPSNDSIEFWAARTLLQLDDGGFFIVTFFDVYNASNYRLALLRTDALGEELWRKEYEAEGDTSLIAHTIFSVDDNTFVLAGGKASPSYVPHEQRHSPPYLLAVDSLGNVKWDWQKDEDSGSIVGITVTKDNGILYSTRQVFRSSNPEPKSILGLAKLDSNFTEEWSYFVDQPPSVSAHYRTLTPTPDGHYVAGGDSGYPFTSTRGIHTKITESGEVLWERHDHTHFGSSSGQRTVANGTVALSSGSIVSCGFTSISEPYGFSDKGWLIKISSDGCIDTLNCWPVSNEEPFVEAFEIQVYPNPANDELTVSLPNTKYKNLTIEFYDITGRFLRKQQLTQGNNHLTISNLPKGMLFYTILSEKGILMNGKLVKE